MNFKELSDLIGNKKKSVIYNQEQIETVDRLTSAFKLDGLMPIVKNVKKTQVVDGVETEVEVPERAIGRLDIKDVISTKELYSLMPEVVTNIMLDAIEPAAVISSNLFTEVPVPPSTTFNFAQIGPFYAGEISELGEYPEVQWDTMEGGNRFRVSINKYGLLIKVSDEVIRDNLINIYSLFLRKAGQALVRKREAVCHDLIQRAGEVVFDNANPTESIYGALAGRSIDGSQNGTPTQHDVLQTFSRLVERGFTPDTMIMHPFAWATFANDPELKEMFDAQSYNQFPGTTSRIWSQLNNPYLLNYNMTGNPTLINPYNQNAGSGVPGQMDPTQSLLMKLGTNPFAQSTALAGVDVNIKAPGYLPGDGRIRVIVSPYVKLQKIGSTWTTDVIFADSKETGVILRGEQPTTESWRNPEIDAQNLKIRESYGVGLLNQGKSIALMKNVVIDKQYSFQNVNQVTLSEINRNNPISF